MHNNKYNILQLTMDKINKLKKIRLQKPTACHPNRKHANHLNAQNIDLDDENNLVPFINRCKIMGYDIQPDLFQYYGYRDTKMGYIHVFKSGGNTVIETWKNMQKSWKNNGLNEGMKVYLRWWNETKRYGFIMNQRWIRSKTNLYNNIFEKQFLFSFVRDPQQRFLSSIFEYLIRANDNITQQYMDK
eukprot:UN13063